jgi:hypothetical protein
LNTKWRFGPLLPFAALQLDVGDVTKSGPGEDIALGRSLTDGVEKGLVIFGEQ